jgi:hypothetical protein
VLAINLAEILLYFRLYNDVYQIFRHSIGVEFMF